MDTLDEYVLKEPGNQNILDIFKGEWSSRLPDKFDLATRPGTARLFEDGRVSWAEQCLGSFKDWRILELGPLEGGHSYIFQDRNAGQVISIEANTRAFLKCLCIKEILKLDRVDFKLGDFVSYLEHDSSIYDMVFASGVLYHMEEPVKLINLMSKVTDRVYIWTHYYDENIIPFRGELAPKFSPLRPFKDDGIIYEGSTQSYMTSLDWKGFCGGPKRISKWVTKDSLIKALNQYGFMNIEINFDEPDHPNGPALAIVAKK